MGHLIYIVADDSRMVAKSFIKKLEKVEMDWVIQKVAPDRDFSFVSDRKSHVIACLSPGMSFEIIRKLAAEQKAKDLFLYFIGTLGIIPIEESQFFSKVPSFRFPSYTLDFNLLFETIEKNDAEKMRVLVVDDEPIILRNIKNWLEADFDVSVVNSGETAIDFLDMHPVDLVLLDYRMPVMDGHEVLKKIRADERIKNLPVMFLTANNDRESVMRVMHLRPDGYILKTKSPDEIKQAVKDFFKTRVVEFESTGDD